MKILLCTPQPISHYLGISRVLIDLRDELIRKGNVVDIVGPLEIGLDNVDFASSGFRTLYTSALKNYLIKNSASYDVVEYDHEFLPFKRTLFSSKPLFVARTVLLVQHTEFIKPKKPWSFRSMIGSLLRFFHHRKRLKDSWQTLMNADLINVPNTHDKRRLAFLGIEESKVCVIPFGLSPSRRSHFFNTKALPPLDFKICFLGSFDYRKGASHFGSIFRTIRERIPDAKLLLLGCGGMINDRSTVLDFFDPQDRDHIDTVFKFDRENIGEYVKDCRIGIFPSYMEGFPFGILEMLTGYLPVIAFDAPGASMMLNPDSLVNVGDEFQFANKVIDLLSDPKRLESERLKAHEISLKFTWDMVADHTIKAYSIRA
tara:strand:+ start:51 stop:1166 length:1116 start_codon:yes stop_codon:yes gene_type:complete